MGIEHFEPLMLSKGIFQFSRNH